MLRYIKYIFNCLITPSTEDITKTYIEYEGRNTLFLPIISNANGKIINTLPEEYKEKNCIQDIYIPATIYTYGSNPLSFFKTLFKENENLENIYIEKGSDFTGCCLGRKIEENEEENIEKNRNRVIDGIYKIEECPTKNVNPIIEFKIANEDDMERINNILLQKYTEEGIKNELSETKTIDEAVAEIIFKKNLTIENEIYFSNDNNGTTLNILGEYKIAKKAFANKEDIINVNIKNVTEIEDNAFMENNQLAQIHMEGVTDINKLGKDVFKGCCNLMRIYVANEEIANKIYDELSSDDIENRTRRTITYGEGSNKKLFCPK